MAWTEEKQAILRRMWNEEHTASTIAEALGRGFSRSAVIAKANRMGLPGRANPIDFGSMFERVVDRVVDAPYGEMTTIIEAAAAEGLNPTVATRMWAQRIEATHGGLPR